jgi:hypothetical protein
MLALFLAFAALPSSPHAAEISALVRTFDGAEPSEGNPQYDAVMALDKYGCEAVEYLAADLRVIPVGGFEVDREGRAQRVIWDLTALRYITGHDFRSTINPLELRAYSETGRYWMTFRIEPGKVRFFGWWPSHGYYYYAPLHAQRDIIRQWRAYAQSGRCRRAPVKDTDFEVYGTGDLKSTNLLDSGKTQD